MRILTLGASNSKTSINKAPARFTATLVSAPRSRSWT